MRRELAIVLLGGVLLAFTLTATGCTTMQQAGRSDPPPEISVRFPATEPQDVSLRTEEQRKNIEELQGLNDETRRPWLKVIEVDVTPREPEKPEEPSE